MERNRLRQYLTKILLDIMFYVGIALYIIIPFIMPRVLVFMGIINASGDARVHYTVISLVAGACVIYIVYHLRRMFATVVTGNPFVMQNVSSLRNCAVASALIAIIFLLRIIVWFTIAASLIVIIFSLLSLFSLTLKDLFKQAVKYKEEADWTV